MPRLTKDNREVLGSRQRFIQDFLDSGEKGVEVEVSLQSLRGSIEKMFPGLNKPCYAVERDGRVFLIRRPKL